MPSTRHRLILIARLASPAPLLADKLFRNGFLDFDFAQDAHGVGAFLRIAQRFVNCVTVLLAAPR